MGLVARADEKNSYAGNFLGLLRLGHNATHYKSKNEGNNPRQFSILDFRFLIVGQRIQQLYPRSFNHALFLNLKSESKI
jgi:hypothetical protein